MTPSDSHWRWYAEASIGTGTLDSVPLPVPTPPLGFEERVRQIVREEIASLPLRYDIPNEGG